MGPVDSASLSSANEGGQCMAISGEFSIERYIAQNSCPEREIILGYHEVIAVYVILSVRVKP
jgi:hypothetical protein